MINNISVDEFYIDPQYKPKTTVSEVPKEPEPYLAEPELIRAVNLAIYLRRPLLLEGEAGCGKTRLAKAVAHKLGLPYYRWDVRSNSKAQDGLYEYDAILRLHDVQIQQAQKSVDSKNTQNSKLNTQTNPERDPSNPQDYRTFGALGKAFDIKECPAVVLIDEIDKADVDFPNDLLTVLDDPWRFKIRETGETIKAKHKPIIIITSNREKGNLPAPFLRRCIYFFLEFPQSRLQEIVDEHNKIKKEEETLVERAVERFIKIRQDKSLVKKPGTSEFLDWIGTLRNFGTLPDKLEQLASEQSVLYRELLFKHRQDWQRYGNEQAG